MLDVNTVFVRQDTKRNRKTISENARRRQRTGCEGFIPNQYLVFGFAGVEFLGLLGILIGIEGIFEGGHAPHAALSVPIDCDELADAFAFGRQQFDFETWRQSERALLF